MRRETGKEQEVQVLYDEGVASHIAPEPCVVSREGQGGAVCVVRDPSMCGHSLFGNREISFLAGAVARRRSAWGRDQTRSPR